MSRNRRGVSATMLAFLLPLLLVILGFTVDFAYMNLVQVEIQAASDLATKAASSVLSDTGSVESARDAGQLVASLNRVGGVPLTLEDSDFTFGSTTKPATGRWEFTPNGLPMNAVCVNACRSNESADGEVELFFSAVTGSGFSTHATATAGFVNSDICLVLDRSSSMKLAVTSNATLLGSGPRSCDSPWADSRWVALSNAVSLFVARMDGTLAEEQVSVVTYASAFSACSGNVSAATVDQALTLDMAQVESAMAALDSSVWYGMTETSVGMELGIDELTGTAARSTAQKIMIVLTDGAYTNGVDPATIARDARDQGIVVHTITFGAVPTTVKDYMKATAAAGGGTHFHAPDEATLNDIFLQIAGSLSVLTD